MQRQPFDLLEILPAALYDIVLDFNWSRELLWALDLPVEGIPVADLRWLLSLPVWPFQGEHFKVSPAEVRRDPARHQTHYVQAMAADIACPLHVLVRASKVVTVLDGFHRLLKADLLGQQMIPVKKVGDELLDTIACTT